MQKLISARDYPVEEELKLAGDNNKPHAIWALLPF